eukprot:1153299-Pelagomonas_calceolata.AAC.6
MQIVGSSASWDGLQVDCEVPRTGNPPAPMQQGHPQKYADEACVVWSCSGGLRPSWESQNQIFVESLLPNLVQCTISYHNLAALVDPQCPRALPSLSLCILTHIATYALLLSCLHRYDLKQLESGIERLELLLPGFSINIEQLSALQWADLVTDTNGVAAKLVALKVGAAVAQSALCGCYPNLDLVDLLQKYPKVLTLEPQELRENAYKVPQGKAAFACTRVFAQGCM